MFPSVIVQIITSAVYQRAEVAVAIVELVGEAPVFALLFVLVSAHLRVTSWTSIVAPPL